MLFFLRPIRWLARILNANASSKQLAYGVAMGMMLGLVPKGNLIAITLATLLFSCRVHLGAAMLTSIAFSWVGLLLDPLSDRLGDALLTWSPGQPLFAELYEMPLIPWTRFNNTVVFGSLMIGLLAFYPVYRLARGGAERYVPVVRARLQRYRVYQVLFGVDVLTSWRSQ